MSVNLGLAKGSNLGGRGVIFIVVVVVLFVCLFAKLLCYLVSFSSLAGLLHAGQLSGEERVFPTDLHGDSHSKLQQKLLLPH